MKKRTTETGNASEAVPEASVKLNELPIAVQALITLLGVMIKPDLVFLTGEGDGRTVPCQLLFVLPDRKQAMEEVQAITELGMLQDPAVHISLVPAGRLRTLLAEGHVFYSFVCRPENLLCGKKNQELVLTDLSRRRKLVAQIIADFNMLYRKALRFKDLAEDQKDLDRNISRYLLYQSVLLLFRAISVAISGQEPQAYSFRELLMNNRGVLPQLNSFFHEDDPQEIEQFVQFFESASDDGRFPRDWKMCELPDAVFKRVGGLLEGGMRCFEERMAGYFGSFREIEMLRGGVGSEVGGLMPDV